MVVVVMDNGSMLFRRVKGHTIGILPVVDGGLEVAYVIENRGRGSAVGVGFGGCEIVIVTCGTEGGVANGDGDVGQENVPARRAQHRSPHQDGASRPVNGDLRSSW